MTYQNRCMFVMLMTAVVGFSSCSKQTTRSSDPSGDLSPGDSGSAAIVELEETGVRPEHVALVVNRADADSVAVGQAYAEVYGISTVIYINTVFQEDMGIGAFGIQKLAIDSYLADTGKDIRVLGLTFQWPRTVDNCMSFAAALTFGYRQRAANCLSSAVGNAYHGQMGRNPKEVGLNYLAMVLPHVSYARDTFQRCKAANHTFPGFEGLGRAYSFSTTDSARNFWRTSNFTALFLPLLIDSGFPTTDVISTKASTDLLVNADDVLFYFVGHQFNLESERATLKTLKHHGSIVSHYTSDGGVWAQHDCSVNDPGQMSACRHIEQGACATFGSVSEPGDSSSKFPKPDYIIPAYLSGATAVQAIYSSMVNAYFIAPFGDPLTQPFGHKQMAADDEGNLVIETSYVTPGIQYKVEASNQKTGEVLSFNVSRTRFGMTEIVVPREFNNSNSRIVLKRVR